MQKYIFTVFSREQNIVVKIAAKGTSYVQAKKKLQSLIGIDDVILEEKKGQ